MMLYRRLRHHTSNVGPWRLEN